MTIQEQLHHLVDELPESELHTAQRFLEYLRDLNLDPVLRAFSNAPEDDEPLTAEDEAAIREAEEEFARGKGIPWEEARVRLGLSSPKEKAG